MIGNVILLVWGNAFTVSYLGQQQSINY